MKRKVPFDISYKNRIISGEVELTMEGHPVEVLKWDRRSRDGNCIIGIVKGCEDEYVYAWNEEGEYAGNPEKDLYMLVEHAELTPFENLVGQTIYCDFVPDMLTDRQVEYIKEQANKLLDAAKEQLQIEEYEWNKDDKKRN